MPDIRQNPNVLDAFDYGPTAQYLNLLTLNWQGHFAGGLAAPLWYDPTQFGFVRTNSLTGVDRRALCKWSPGGTILELDGDDQEIWAHEIGGTGSGKSWRLALTKNDVFAGLFGYSFTISVGTAGGAWFIRRYDGTGAGTILAYGGAGCPTADPGWCLLRRVGNNLEAWIADSSGEDTDNWSLVTIATDTNYMTGLVPTLWIADDARQGHGYDYFGGGPSVAENRTQIYRWIYSPTRNS